MINCFSTFKKGASLSCFKAQVFKKGKNLVSDTVSEANLWICIGFILKKGDLQTKAAFFDCFFGKS